MGIRESLGEKSDSFGSAYVGTPEAGLETYINQTYIYLHDDQIVKICSFTSNSHVVGRSSESCIALRPRKLALSCYLAAALDWVSRGLQEGFAKHLKSYDCQLLLPARN